MSIVTQQLLQRLLQLENSERTGDTKKKKEKEYNITPTNPNGLASPLQGDSFSKLKNLQMELYNSLIPYVETYGKEMIRSFYDWWSQPNKSGTDCGWHLQKTWSLEARLRNWSKREKNNNHGTNDNSYGSDQRKRDSAVAVATSVSEAAAKRRAELAAEGII